MVVATGIYPPDIGGPAQYAKEVAEAWKRAGYNVFVCNFGAIRFLPIGVRHLAYFFWVWWRSVGADFIFIPDTFSAAVPAVAVGRILGKKTVIRTGGDFLWEQYVERTGDLVLLRHFYTARLDKINAKEQIIFRLVGWALRNASAVVFSTAWQRDIFTEPYRLNLHKCFIVENCYQVPSKDIKIRSYLNNTKVFVGGTRKLKWKNRERLQRAFALARSKHPGLVLDLETAPRKAFLEKINNAYAVIIVSLGDISPNTILDALRAGTPFVLTRECGIVDRVGDSALLVDPENERDIAEKILWLADERNYAAQTAKVRSFSFSHSWDEIAREILALLD